jgi:hypothetical protein
MAEEEEVQAIKKIMTEAELDLKVDNLMGAKEKLEQAEKIARQTRNEDLLKQILDLRKRSVNSKRIY